MTERLADLSARITGVRQLGAVVNAMRGIAAARAQQARGQLIAVDSYSDMIAAAIGRILDLGPNGPPPLEGQAGLVVFCAEQGFAGAFSERVLDAAVRLPGKLLLVGTRGLAAAEKRGLKPAWTASMPAHSQGIPKLAASITTALYATMDVTGSIEVLFTDWQPGRGTTIEHRRLLPFNPAAFPPTKRRNPPLLNLPPAALLSGLTAEYLHAQLCKAALYAFAAENEARMESTAAASTQIERQLTTLQSTQRIVRQGEITAEIIELAAGETASRGRR